MASGSLSSVMVSKLDYETISSEFESHRVPNISGLVALLSKS